MKAQTSDFCVADPVTVEIDSQNRTPGDAQLYTPKVYNMTFWAVYRADGSSDYTVAENDALEVIANMNREFNRFNIFFKYRGVNYLFNDEAYFVELTCDSDDDDDSTIEGLSVIKNLSNLSGNFDPNGLNTYIFYDSCGFSGFYSGVSLTERNVYVRSVRFKDYHTVQEVGHMFGLDHSWKGVKEYDPNNPNQICEHVTRNTADPAYNADEQGDDVIDTAAMPRFSKIAGNVNYVNPNTCVYDGDGRDCQNTLFQIPPNSSGTLNFMNDGTECPTTSYTQANDPEGFTIQQGLKMRLKIEADPSRFGPAETNLESLYEPYKGTYYNVGPNNTSYTPLFQPGFNYAFIECDGPYPQPAPYGESFSFIANNLTLVKSKYIDPHFYNTIVHPNHSAISIKEVNDALGAAQVQKCYYNNNRSAIGGKVTKFNDDTFNANVTITPKDSTAINNPVLIDELPAGLYQIQKTYDDGETQEVIIQKGNN